jgi:hypothetical protein
MTESPVTIVGGSIILAIFAVVCVFGFIYVTSATVEQHESPSARAMTKE